MRSGRCLSEDSQSNPHLRKRVFASESLAGTRRRCSCNRDTRSGKKKNSLYEKKIGFPKTRRCVCFCGARRRLVSILHAGGERARRGLLPSARTAGCVVVFVIAELRAPSRSRTRCRCHAPRLPVPLARAASSASRVPSAWRPSRPRAAPPPPCTLAHASASASADRLSWATPLRRRLVSRRHVARASPARSADFDLRALDPPMAASDGPRGQRPPERVRRCAESELNQQIIPWRPASLSRPKRAAAATLQAIDRSRDEQDRAIPSQYSAGTTQRTALDG